jgi:hypothetical protein
MSPAAFGQLLVKLGLHETGERVDPHRSLN